MRAKAARQAWARPTLLWDAHEESFEWDAAADDGQARAAAATAAALSAGKSTVQRMARASRSP